MRKAPRRQALRPRETPLARASLQSQSLVDLLTDPRDEPRRHLLGETARAKGVAPLAIRQLLQPLARPAHVVGSDRAQQFLMASLVAERHASVRRAADRSEEHTSELQSQSNLVCRLLLEKKTPTRLSRSSTSSCSGPSSRYSFRPSSPR